MRARLVRRFVAVALFAVVLLGVPLGLIGRAFVRAEAVRIADREADSVGFAAQPYLAAGEPVPPSAVAEFVGNGRYIEITDARRHDDDVRDARSRRRRARHHRARRRIDRRRVAARRSPRQP